MKSLFTVLLLSISIAATAMPSTNNLDDVKDNKAVSQLMKAAKVGDIPTLSQALASNVDINVTTSTGATSLMIAAKWGNASIVEVLLKEGADANIKNKSGHSAYDFAVAYGHDEVASIIAKYL
jgi:ankyrin repeat protein